MKKKILLPAPPQKEKRNKKQGALSACLGLLLAKELVTIFGLG
jgi:hypothetical protein